MRRKALLLLLFQKVSFSAARFTGIPTVQFLSAPLKPHCHRQKGIKVQMGPTLAMDVTQLEGIGKCGLYPDVSLQCMIMKSDWAPGWVPAVPATSTYPRS